jgi:hypothetical protein
MAHSSVHAKYELSRVKTVSYRAFSNFWIFLQVPLNFKIPLGPPKSAPIALILSPVIPTFEGADDAIDRLKKFARVQKLQPQNSSIR